MSHIFICYSREDFEDAQRIVDALAANHLDVWVDRKSIPSGEDWVQEIYQGIEGAEAFLFLLSPASVESEMCNMEIVHAIRSGKRILPIFIANAERTDIYSITEKFPNRDAKEEINRRNFIFCSQDRDNFKTAIEEIQRTIRADYEWLRYHTRLQVKAAEWKRNNYEKSLLLQGKELQMAETRLAKYSSAEPYPTGLQKDYVQKSRQESDRRRRLVSIISLLATIVLAGAAFYGLRQKTLAREHELSTQAGELAAQSVALRESNFPLTLLLGVEAYTIHEDDRTLGVLRANAQENPRLVTYWYGNSQTSFDQIHPISFSPDGKILAVQRRDHILLQDVETGAVIGQPVGENIFIYGGKAFSPNGELMALADMDHNIALWNIRSGQPVGQPFQGHTDMIRILVFSPDGKRLASAGLDQTVIVWDGETGNIIAELSGTLPNPSQLVFRPDGQILLFFETANKTILWDIETGQTISRSFEEQAPERGRGISPDGNTLVSYTWWQMAFHIWNVDTGQPTGQPLVAGSDQSSSVVAFSPDGKILASAGADKSILIWDVESGRQLGQPLRGQLNDHIELVFSPDGSKLAGGDEDMIVFWDLDSDAQPIKELNPRTLIQLTCQRAGRNLTQAEWTQYFPDEGYRITCPQYPAGE